MILVLKRYNFIFSPFISRFTYLISKIFLNKLLSQQKAVKLNTARLINRMKNQNLKWINS